MTVENGYTLKLENITINNATATEGGVIYNKGNLEINNSKSIKTTIVNGKINITLPTDTLPEGEHNITLDVKENDDYTNKTIDSIVVTHNRNAIIEIVDINNPIEIGGQLSINTTIVDTEGKPVDQGKVTFKINGTTIATVDVINGYANTTYILPEEYKAGEYEITAEFQDKYYNPAEDKATLTIIKHNIADTTIPEQTIKTQTNTTIEVQLNDTNGNPVEGNTIVEVIVDGKPVENVTVVDGKVNITIPTDTLPAGEHNITLDVKENEEYNNKTIETKVIVENRDATIDIVDVNNPVEIGGQLSINTTIVDTEGKPVDQGKVTFKINGTTIATVDVKEGTANITYTLPEEYKAGEYQVTAEFEDEYYNPAEDNKTFTIQKHDIADVTIPEQTIKTQTNTTIEVQLNDTNGNPIEGNTTVEVIVDGKPVENVTVVDGKVNITVPTDTLPAGEHNITLDVKENEKYNNKTIETKVIVENRNAIIDIVGVNTPYAISDLFINTTIVDEDGSIIKDGVVIFKINGKTLKDANNETVRISVHDGVANIKYLLPSSIGGARYNVTAVFSNKYYNRAEDNDNLTILKYAIENKTFDPIVIKTHQNATINMTLKDEFGNTIVTETNVTIKINNKTFTKTTIKDGVLNIELDVENLKANNYTIDVIYGENQIYLRGENSIQLNIVNRSVTIDLDTNATHTNGQIPIHATITDDVDGKLVDNGTVTFKINGITQLDENGNAIRFEIKDGIIDATYNLPPTIAARSHNMTLVYSNEGYDRCEETTNYTVIKSDIADLKVSNITTKYGENTTISTIICDEDGKAVSAATKIAVKVDGRTLIHDVVENGVVNITVDTDDLFIGDHKIDIVFGENSFYNEKRVEIPLIIEE
ncbi:MAG: Ig-like domain-containing protein [Methanosphaera sp.]|uniref:Ig-like domain-containing protein n=1 Tax=Methanosphaera sp. TaxID=2666342 RepID=UPI00261B8227|nr:Ig-like domain-containing protein [Methanosphaera sp.]MDD6534217.1 Ig-like domain-containing protein [Methanosphaera sp.]